jgi:hypothetical protein
MRMLRNMLWTILISGAYLVTQAQISTDTIVVHGLRNPIDWDTSFAAAYSPALDRILGIVTDSLIQYLAAYDSACVLMRLQFAFSSDSVNIVRLGMAGVRENPKPPRHLKAPGDGMMRILNIDQEIENVVDEGGYLLVPLPVQARQNMERLLLSYHFQYKEPHEGFIWLYRYVFRGRTESLTR